MGRRHVRLTPAARELRASASVVRRICAGVYEKAKRLRRWLARTLQPGAVMMPSRVRSRSVNHSRDESRARVDRRPTISWRVAAPPLELTVCDGCGAVYCHKTWRRSPERQEAAKSRGVHGLCPACLQAHTGKGYGKVLVSGEKVDALHTEVERRVSHVCARAAFTQPENRLVSMRPTDEGLEIVTTTQNLAHRIARELEKAFGGKARYSWASGDGRLLARWTTPPARTRGGLLTA
jgi:hypothetical protein